MAAPRRSTELTAPQVKVLLAIAGGKIYLKDLAVGEEKQTTHVKLQKLQRLGYIRRGKPGEDTRFVPYIINWRKICEVWFKHNGRVGKPTTADEKFAEFYFEKFVNYDVYNKHRMGDLRDVFDFFEDFIASDFPSRPASGWERTAPVDGTIHNFMRTGYAKGNEETKGELGLKIYNDILAKYPRRGAAQR